MRIENRKKLATIKKKVIGGMYDEMGKRSRGSKTADDDYSEALKLLGKAIDDIELMFGNLD